MRKFTQLAVVATLCMCSAIAIAQTIADFPNPQNVRVEAGVMKWDAVPDAGGYNIYFNASTDDDAFPVAYYTTVRDTTELQLMNSGTYSVVSFNQDASLYSIQWSAEVRVKYEEGDSQEEQTRWGSSSGPIHLFSVTCRNVGPGGSCIASCTNSNDQYAFHATGGACSTSDVVEADASADTSSYKCTVPTFSGEVRAQVYCLNYNLFNR